MFLPSPPTPLSNVLFMNCWGKQKTLVFEYIKLTLRFCFMFFLNVFVCLGNWESKIQLYADRHVDDVYISCVALKLNVWRKGVMAWTPEKLMEKYMTLCLFYFLTFFLDFFFL